MTRRPLIAGNWKMHGTLKEAASLTQGILKDLRKEEGVDLVLCPPFTALACVGALLTGTRVLLGAQNVYCEPQGPFTGEISPDMLKDAGCSFSIIGHSERRIHFGETDPLIRRKLLALLKAKLRVILCVGETREERQTGRTWAVIEEQLRATLEETEPVRVAHEVVIAYEPVWAIGTGLHATPGQAQEIHEKIRGWLVDRIGKSGAQSVRIQYGGSVKPENAFELLSQPDIDGALIGGASLDTGAFIRIVEAAHQAKGSPCSTA